MLLLLYVDDLKVVARASEHKQIWKELRGAIHRGDEQVDERFLGCRYTDFAPTAVSVQDMLKQYPSYHRRPHLTKEDCNGNSPERMKDPKRNMKGRTNDMDILSNTAWAPSVDLQKYRNRHWERYRDFILG